MSSSMSALFGSDLKHKVHDLHPRSKSADVSYLLSQKTTELTLASPDGLNLAIKCWGPEHADINVLALHGFMDNAATWDNLAPYLVSAERGCSIRLVCMDFSGHGLSSHRPKSSTYVNQERAAEVKAVADVLQWDRFAILAHSMGTAVAVLVASAMPERITGMVLCDGFGPWVQPGKYDPVGTLRSYLKERDRLMHRQRRVYADLDTAVEKYRQTVAISRESARTLVARGTEEVEVWGVQGGFNNQQESQSSPRGPPKDGPSERGICFRHDPRLRGSSWVATSHDTSLAFAAGVRCPTLLLFADNERRRRFWKAAGGAGAFRKQMVEKVNTVSPDLLRLCIVHDADHHFHMDNVETVFSEILDFFNTRVYGAGRSGTARSKL